MAQVAMGWYKWIVRWGNMRYRIALRHTEEGFSVSVPGLPGCWSQGETAEDAIENING